MDVGQSGLGVVNLKQLLKRNDFCAAILTSKLVSRGQDPIFATEFADKSPSTKRRKREQIAVYIGEWLRSGFIPRIEIQAMVKWFPKVVESIPLFRYEASRPLRNDESSTGIPHTTDDHPDPIVACPSQVIPSPLPPPAPLPEPVQFTRPSQPISMDLCDSDSNVWEDVADPVQSPLDDDLLQFLFRSNRTQVKVLPFVRILQHWSVVCKISHQHISTLLKLIKKFRSTISESDIDALPSSAQTLLKLTNSDLGQVQSSKVKNEKGAAIGTYMHYGVEAGVLGISPGLFF